LFGFFFYIFSPEKYYFDTYLGFLRKSGPKNKMPDFNFFLKFPDFYNRFQQVAKIQKGFEILLHSSHELKEKKLVQERII
jgi:hypothetical protein